MAADITITDPEIIVQPAVDASKIELVTNNVVQIINDLAQGLATGSININPNDPTSTPEEFRVQYAFEAQRARDLIGKFRRESGNDLHGVIDSNETVLTASEFDALLTARIQEYISKITINDGTGFEAGRNADPNTPQTPIAPRANAILNEGLRQDLMGYYKEQILLWVSDVFMDADGTGVKAGIDSIKELLDVLNDPTNANATGVLNRITSLESRATALETRATAIETDIGSASDASTKTTVRGVIQKLREDLSAEVTNRENADTNIWNEIGTDGDLSPVSTVLGKIQKLRDDFTTEKDNSDANDDKIETHLVEYKNQIQKLNTFVSSIGTQASFERAEAKVVETRNLMFNKFRTAKTNNNLKISSKTI